MTPRTPTLAGVAAIFFWIGTAAAAPVPELLIYTYDSFIAQGGMGPEIFPAFEKNCGCKIRALPSGDGGQLVTRVQLDSEQGRQGAQIVLGVDEPTFERAKPWLDTSWRPAGIRALSPDLKPEAGFVPYDYGFFAFIADLQALHEAKSGPPARLSELLDPRFKRGVILEDPRTSTPGLAFMLYADAVAPSETAFWPAMRTQWLTLAPGWDGAYGLFLRKEAPLVWSYTTSQAYHEEHGDPASGRRYQAVLFDEGQPMQVEGAAIVKGGFPPGPSGEKLRGIARDFLEYLLSSEVQAKIPLHNWMYPARRGTALPDSFRHLPKPKKIVRLPAGADSVKAALDRWSKAVEGGR